MVSKEAGGVMCPRLSRPGLWLDVMVLYSFVPGDVVHKGMVMEIHFFHSRWLIQINSTEMVTESTVLGGHQQLIRTVLMSPSGVLMGSVSTF